jgi:hypothetical protein
MKRLLLILLSAFSISSFIQSYEPRLGLFAFTGFAGAVAGKITGDPIACALGGVLGWGIPAALAVGYGAKKALSNFGISSDFNPSLAEKARLQNEIRNPSYWNRFLNVLSPQHLETINAHKQEKIFVQQTIKSQAMPVSTVQPGLF